MRAQVLAVHSFFGSSFTTSMVSSQVVIANLFTVTAWALVYFFAG